MKNSLLASEELNGRIALSSTEREEISERMKVNGKFRSEKAVFVKCVKQVTNSFSFTKFS